jgi:hypothetical protein
MCLYSFQRARVKFEPENDILSSTRIPEELIGQDNVLDLSHLSPELPSRASKQDPNDEIIWSSEIIDLTADSDDDIYV